MKSISRGERAALDAPAFSAPFRIDLSCEAPGMAIDWSCFGLDAAEKLSDDRYMVFFNQTSSPEGALKLLSSDASSASFEANLATLPASVDRLVLTAAIDGDGAMRSIRSGSASFGGEISFSFSGSDFADEKALILAEIYRKNGQWRLSAVGQGFNGGLSALLAHFGGEEAAPASAPAAQSPAAPSAPAPVRLSLDKRIEKEAPHLISLAKTAQISLEKKGLSGHRAKVALCLDISASMDKLYRDGKVQALADRIMALATRLDDDGELDIFLFGEEGHQPAPMKLEGCSTYVRDLLRSHPLEGGTRYHKAMKLIREHYCGSSEKREAPLRQDMPVYVMFVTDGGTSNRESAIAQLRFASYEPIFWQFMAIGKTRGLFGSNFDFLEKLDDLSGRHVDNADFFCVEDPSKISEEDLYAKMMNEYPGWIPQAKAKGLLP